MHRRQFVGLAAAGAANLLAGRSTIQAADKRLDLRGAYSSPKSFWESGARLNEYGINAVFVHAGSLTEALIARARSEGARVFAEFPTLNGKEWLMGREGSQNSVVEEHAEAWPIDSEGKRSPMQSWFMGICPTNEAFMSHRLEELKQLVTSRQIDGVWLDYLHWHAQFEDPKPGLPETCFNDSCISQFQRDARIELKGTTAEERAKEILSRHQLHWRDWRCRTLMDFARRCREVIWEHAPHLLVGCYHCGWRDDEFQGARRKILGLDVGMMADVFDVLSPMLYHGRSSQSPGWVERNVKWWSHQLGLRGEPAERLKLWPIVQAWSDPEGRRVSAEEFERVLTGGMASGATGVMMFTLGAVTEDPRKMATLKKVYLPMQSD
ncbi:MAG: hypothetical protein AB1898_04190 [Acidobacteriota bacterium]